MKSSNPIIPKENKLMDEIIISVFYDIDNFCKELKIFFEHSLLPCDENPTSFEPPSALSLSEIMTICVLFHLSGYRTFKWYYTKFIQKDCRKFFPRLVSYNRFVELMPYAAMPLALFVQAIGAKSPCTGISFVDSTTLDVCDSHRIQQHKVFAKIAQRGKCSTGWFYGFKLHLVINDRGEILSFCLTPGNVDDRNRKVMKSLTKKLFGKLFADKGYVSKKLFVELLENGVELITKQKKNTKNPGMLHLTDRLLLRKRAVIESVNDFLKNTFQIEHSRHRSRCNFVVNLVAGLAAYSFLPKKPSIYTRNMTFV